MTLNNYVEHVLNDSNVAIKELNSLLWFIFSNNNIKLYIGIDDNIHIKIKEQ